MFNEAVIMKKPLMYATCPPPISRQKKLAVASDNILKL